MKKFLAVLMTAAMLMGMISVPAIATGEDEVYIISPEDNATYFEEDVIISVNSPDEVPVITFDGEELDVDISDYPVYTATVAFDDASLGYHNVEVEIGDQKYSRTVELYSNIVEKRYIYKFIPSEGQKLCIYYGEGNYYDGRKMNEGTLEQIAGSDGKTDDAFKMTKTGGDAYIQFIGEYTDAQHPQADSVYSVAFDVKRANDDSVFDMEGKSKAGWTWLGRPEAFIGADGKIDNSDVVLPADEWHNIELVFETKNEGNYWVYLDGEMIHTQATTYDYSSIYLMKFQLKNGSMDFDNFTYGKYIINPRIESVGYIADGNEMSPEDDIVSTGAEKIVLNLTSAYDSVGSVKVNGVSATAELSGKKLIVTPPAALPANEVINIEVSADSKASGETLGKSVNYMVETGNLEFSIASPADKAVYFDKDIEISVISPTSVPTVTFDGATVALDNSKAPEYTATIAFADKKLGIHDVVIKADGKEYKRTVELCSNIGPTRFTYKFYPSEGQKVCIYQGEGNYYDGRSINNGTLEQVPGSDGKTDDAFKMTKTGGDAYFQFIGEYTDAQHPQANSVYSVAFDVKRTGDGAVFDMEGKSQGGYTWLGRPESFICADGKIDNSNVVLPAGEWHNIELVFETKAQGNYWVYLDGEMIHSQATTYDYSSIYLMKFQMKNGSMEFDNLSYGKYIVNPRVSSVAYIAGGEEAEADGNIISPDTEKIILNLTSAFDAGTVTASNVTVDGIAVSDVVLEGKKLTITPAVALERNADINIEIGANATVLGEELGKSVVYRVRTVVTSVEVIAPEDNATYFDEDVVISVISPKEVPVVTFDGAAVALDDSKAPTYTATVTFADKNLGTHDIVIKAEGKEFKKTVEFYSNTVEKKFLYKFYPEEGQKLCVYNGEGNYHDGRAINNGTFEQVAGSDGKTDDAFKMTKTGADAFIYLIHEYVDAEHPIANAAYSVSFDVKRADDGAVFDMEGKSQGGYTWLGKPEAFIGADGKIDNSDVVLPAGEWHNIELVFETKNQGNYWVYLDGEMIHTQATTYDYSSIYLMKFQMKNGAMEFDNLSYGKYIVNPALESVAYVEEGEEISAEENVISPAAEKIVLNLTSAYDSVGSVKVNGVVAADVEVDGKKLIITPSGLLSAKSDVKIEVSADAKVYGETLGKSVVYKIKTSELIFGILSPVDNATYSDKDVVISVVSTKEVPVVTFDGEAVNMDSSKAPTYTATIPFADKYLGLHDVVITVNGKEYKRTVELCSNIGPTRFTYKYLPSEGQKLCIYQGEGNYHDGRTINHGSFEQIADSDSKTDDAFKMIKTGDSDAFVYLINEYVDAEHPAANSVYSVAFDVKRANDGAIFDLEGKSQGGYTWLGKPEAFISADGKIDNSDVVLPAGEWHNIELVFETKNEGNYWVYLDGKMIHTQATTYDYSSIYLMKFQMKKGAMDFDNLSYGKYIVNPRMESASYFIDDEEFDADDNKIAPTADKIILNLTSAYDSVSAVAINGVAAANVEVDGNNLIITPAGNIEGNVPVEIKINSGNATVSGITLTKDVVYKLYTYTLNDKLISFTIEGTDEVSAKLVFEHGYACDSEEVMVVISAYDENGLVGIKSARYPLAIGEQTITSAKLSVPTGATVKAFAWRDDMTSIAKAEK